MYDVITIGTVTVDTFIKADFLKTVRDTEHLEKIGFMTGQAQCFSMGSKIEIQEPIIEIGGGAHNAAVTFSRAGLKTAALFNVGNDKEGEMVIREIIKKEIRPFEIVDKNKKTGVSYILLSKSGERTILVNRGCSGDIEGSEVPFGKLEAKWAYIAPGSIPISVLKKIFLTLKENKTKIAINPSKDFLSLGYKKIKSFLDLASVVIMNREEAAYLTHVPYEITNEIFVKLDKYVSGIAVMTDGGKGSLATDGTIIYESGVFKEKKLVDRTGAGDAFGSGFVAGLIETNEQCHRGACSPHKIIYALRRAAANATGVIENIGAGPGILTLDEFLNQRRWKKLKIETRKVIS
jgi:sugar/nucleoside kinase (ribokinase family)